MHSVFTSNKLLQFQPDVFLFSVSVWLFIFYGILTCAHFKTFRNFPIVKLFFFILPKYNFLFIYILLALSESNKIHSNRVLNRMYREVKTNIFE